MPPLFFQWTMLRPTAVLCCTLILFQVLSEGFDSTAHPHQWGIQAFLMIPAHYVQNSNIYVKEIPLDLEKNPERDSSTELLSSEIQTDQSSNIMIKCLFIFLNIKCLYTSILLINSPPILKKKKKIKKRIKCVLLWAEPHPIL